MFTMLWFSVFYNSFGSYIVFLYPLLLIMVYIMILKTEEPSNFNNHQTTNRGGVVQGKILIEMSNNTHIVVKKYITKIS